MAKTLFDIREEHELMEKLTAADPTGQWISDFVKSDNPKFAGKSKKERIKMALGAAYAAKRQNEDVEPVDEVNLKPEHRAAIRRLRPSGEHSKTMLKHDSGKQIHVTREGDKVHLVTHEIGAGTGKKTTMNYSQFDEAAWGQDKMANLKAAHDRHAEKAIQANKAGDHEAVKVHQSKMNMIKTQMNRLRKEEVEQIDEVGDTAKGQKMLSKVHTRSVNRMIKAIDTKDPKAAKKNQDTANRAWDRFDVKEEAELAEAGGMKSAALVKAMMKKQKKFDAMSPEKQNQQRQQYQDKKQNEAYKEPPMSAQEKLYQQHQALRKKRGLPDPEHYKRLAQQKAQEILDLKNEK
jgi:hypothetical protein